MDRTAGADPGVLLAYMDAFWVLMLISLSAVPLVLTLRKIKLGGAVHVSH
jgi:MFS transporter, DHA2 family, multidrug resistance protein